MKFFGQPNMLVMDSRKHKPLFKFDENGIYETEDESIIPRLKVAFEYEETPIEIEKTQEIVPVLEDTLVNLPKTENVKKTAAKKGTVKKKSNVKG